MKLKVAAAAEVDGPRMRVQQGGYPLTQTPDPAGSLLPTRLSPKFMVTLNCVHRISESPWTAS